MVAGRQGADGADHEVAGGVLGARELDHVGAVAHDAQGQGAEGVGDEVGRALAQDAVAEQGAEHLGMGPRRGAREFRLWWQQGTLRSSLASPRMAVAMASSVAVSQACSASTMSGFTCSPRMRPHSNRSAPAPSRSFFSMLLRNHFLIHIDAGDARGDREHVVQVMVHRERQVTRPAAAIEDLQVAAEVSQAGIVEHVKELLQELVDLRVLGPHGRPHAAVACHDPHHFEQAIRAALRQRHVLGAVVGFGRRGLDRPSAGR